MEYVVVPKRATEAMFMAAMFDTRQPPDLIWDAMVKAAEPRDLESVTKEYFKAGCEWECRLHEGHRERTIRELIEQAEEIGATINSPLFVTIDRATGEELLYSTDLATWLKSQIEGE